MTIAVARKGKRVTAVIVWRPLAKISTSYQRYAVDWNVVISYWWLIVTVSILFTVWGYFCVQKLKGFIFAYCIRLSGGTSSNISVFSGLQFSHWQYMSIFIRLAVVASLICEKHAKFWENSNLQQFKVIRGHRSILVPIESAYAASFQSLTVTLDVFLRYRSINLEIACFSNLILFWRPRSEFLDETSRKN